jgi:general secretion pathway protein K
MKRKRDSSGFALLLVLWTLVILSAIALTLAASAGTEIRSSQDSWNDLQAERLASSGHELAAYLETRALGTNAEDLTGLPVQPVVAGMNYRIAVDAGTIDIRFEGDNAKFDVAAATEAANVAFFTSWTGDPNRGREIAASIADWIDANDEPRPFGAESEYYRSRGYRPRNSGLGMADLFLVKGLTPEDFKPVVTGSGNRLSLRTPLARMITAVPSGNRVNPNYASPSVLQSLTGMTPETAATILADRERSAFSSPQDFSNRIGIPPNSPLLASLTFDRGAAPAVLSVGHVRNSTRNRTERRVGRMRSPSQLTVLIDRNVVNW